MATLDRRLADDAVLVADTGYSSAWAGALSETKQAGRNFIRADGSLGWAFPAALGAQLAAPDRQVVCITGDGGFGYHIGDIETAIRQELPVIVVILNNQTLAFEEHVQDLLYGKVVPEVNEFVDINYGAIARAFGANGFRVANVEDFERALATGSSAADRRSSTPSSIASRSRPSPATTASESASYDHHRRSGRRPRSAGGRSGLPRAVRTSTRSARSPSATRTGGVGARTTSSGR